MPININPLKTALPIMNQALSAISTAASSAASAANAAKGSGANKSQSLSLVGAPQTAGPKASGAITKQQIAKALDAIKIRTTQNRSGDVAPNFKGLNDIASSNTHGKKTVFIPLQKTHRRLGKLQRKLAKQQALTAKQKPIVEQRKAEYKTAQKAVSDLETKLEASTKALKNAAPEDRKQLQLAKRNVQRALGAAKKRMNTAKQKLGKSEKNLARMTGNERSFEKQIAGEQKTLEKQGKALVNWVKKHGISHNRELQALSKQMKKTDAAIRKLKRQKNPNAQALQALESKFEWLNQQMMPLIGRLQSQVEDFEAMTPREQNVHSIDVEGNKITLSDNVIAYATDTAEGLGGKAKSGDGPQVVAARLKEMGLSQDKQNILAIVSSSEGTFTKMNTWDRAKITLGFIQWTSGAQGNGTMIDLMRAIKRSDPAAYRARFAKYGIDIQGQQLKLTRADGTVLRGAKAAAAIQTDPKLVAVLAASGLDPAIQKVQIREAEKRKMDAQLKRSVSVDGKNVKLGTVLTSEYGVGLMTDRSVHSGEGGTRGMFKSAMERFFKDNPKADLSDAKWASKAEAYVIKDFEAKQPDRARKFSKLSKAHGSYSG